MACVFVCRGPSGPLHFFHFITEKKIKSRVHYAASKIPVILILRAVGLPSPGAPPGKLPPGSLPGSGQPVCFDFNKDASHQF
jgi:hypothetical protein